MTVVDGEGVEIAYELYSPLLQSIEVLKLERRVDEDLGYLIDAPQEFSYVPFDMQPIPHPHGAPVPLNTLKVAHGAHGAHTAHTFLNNYSPIFS